MENMSDLSFRIIASKTFSGERCTRDILRSLQGWKDCKKIALILIAYVSIQAVLKFFETNKLRQKTVTYHVVMKFKTFGATEM